MTYSKRTILMCDGEGREDDDECYEMYGMEIGISTATELREIAESDGWVYRNGEDYCPKCK